MRILVDTNVLLDYLLIRDPFTEDARKIVVACKEGRVFGCIAAHSISNIFFILRKEYSIEERRTVLLDICQLFDVEGIDKSKINKALSNKEFSDFEDCLQMECAISYKADFIVTRNIKDYQNSPVECIEPNEFVKSYLEKV